MTNLVLPLGASTDGVGNNFGELLPSSLAGTVYVDLNNNGKQDPGEPGIPDVTVTLTGVDDLSQSIETVLVTDASGQYLFDNLRPGSYTITEAQPAGYFSGKNSIGTQGGTVGPNDTLTNIVLTPAIHGTGNNFAELLPAGLSGFVYWDLNHDGVRDSADFGIVNVTITLRGVDDQGHSVQSVTITNDQGAYQFAGLRPGHYSITETQPPHFRSYVNNVGTLGGQVGNDQFTSIVLTLGADGQAYNFGELQLPGCRLRCIAVSVGNRVAFDLALRARNPARFDRLHPQIGPVLAQGQVPRGVSGYPKGPLAYALVPTLGAKRIMWRIDPKTGKPILVGIPNFSTSAAPYCKRPR